MDLAVLQRVAQELDEILSSGFVNKIHQPLPREMVLRIRVPGGGERKLVLSADPALGRIHLTDVMIPNPPSPPRFCAFLRAHLKGARIVSITGAEDDRVVRIATVRGPEPGREERDLILELLGRDSNVLLLDRTSGMIMDCLHRIPEKESGSRPVMPGATYLPPQKRPILASPSVEAVGVEGFKPGIRTGPGGKRQLVLDAGQPGDELFPSLNQAVDAFFMPRLESLLLESFRRELAHPLRTGLRAVERRIARIKTDIQRLRDLADRQMEGELLKANLRRVQRGQAALVVEDWTTGGERIIGLDPSIGPVANMNQIFKKAAKGKRGEKIAQNRLEMTLEEKAALEELLFFVEEASNIVELERCADDVEQMGAADTSGHSAPSGKGFEGNPYREFRTPSGRPILVGKSGKGNDFILRRKAQKGDLWFHVKGFSGAHVLLPASGAGPVTEQDRGFAAGMAVHFSRARGRGKTEVMVADVRDVHRIKGGLPGQVTVKNYRTMISDGRDAGEIALE